MVLVSLLFTLSSMALSAPSYGDVEVVPDPGEPGIILDGTEIIHPDPLYVPVDVDQTPTDPTPPANLPNTICEIDDAGINQCYFVSEIEDPADPEPERELTPGDVLRATREIGLPSLKVQIQPGEQTLVNVATIFYAQPQAFARSVSLLGFDVDVEAKAISYQWIHGDGTTKTTSTPGRPYPSKEITHRYREPADEVQARVDVTYQVRYRVDGGAWQTIGQTLLASGLVAELDVKEAAPVMTKPRV